MTSKSDGEPVTASATAANGALAVTLGKNPERSAIITGAWCLTSCAGMGRLAVCTSPA